MPNNQQLSNVGERIRHQREDYLGLSQEELANAIGLSLSAVSQIELGNRKVSEEKICEIAFILSCSMEYLLNGKAEEYPKEVVHLARTSGRLSENDQKELLKFGQFLASQKKNIKNND